MLLAIDVGNTQTAIGVYRESTLLHMWRLATNKSHTSDELRMKIIPLMASENIDCAQLQGAALASVVPALGSAWRAALRQMLGTEPVVCSAESAGSLFKTTYPNPSEIGADRIADAVAAQALYGAPIVVVDFGTATNIEVIDKDGFFLGGIIAPGLEASAAALFANATKIPAVELIEPDHVIGRNTKEAVQSGVVYGEVDRLDGLIRRIFEELGYTTPVVATGGLSERMAPLSCSVTEINPELTLEGLRLISNAANH